VVPLLFLIFPLLIFSGCVYLRLLEVKKQLKDFDAHFTLSGRSDLVIEFNHPVLRASDAVFLVGADPLFQETAGGETLYHYAFTLVGSTGTAEVALGRLPLTLAVAERKLTKIIVPESFMYLFPRSVFIEVLRQAADAEVFQLRKTVHRRIRLPTTVDAELPSATKVLHLLGPAAEETSTSDGITRLYRYRIAGAERKAPIRVQLTFRPDGLLTRVVVTWGASTVDAEFLRDPA
jgi:hypothetical protein